MKISLNTVLLLAILAMATWYFFFKPVPVQAMPEQTVQEPTTIIKEIIRVINGRSVLKPEIRQQSAPSNPALDSFHGKVNWKK